MTLHQRVGRAAGARAKDGGRPGCRDTFSGKRVAIQALKLRQNRADCFPSPHRKPIMDRRRLSLRGAQKGLRMLQSRRFDDEELFPS